MAEYDSFSDDTLDGGKFINNLFGGGNNSEETIGSETFINNLFNDENYDIVGGNDSEGTIGGDTFINNLSEDNSEMSDLDGGFIFNLFKTNKRDTKEFAYFFNSKKLSDKNILKMTGKSYTLTQLANQTNIIKLDKSYYDILKSIGAWEKVKDGELRQLSDKSMTNKLSKKLNGGNPYKSLLDKLPLVDTQFVIQVGDDIKLVNVILKNITNTNKPLPQPKILPGDLPPSDLPPSPPEIPFFPGPIGNYDKYQQKYEKYKLKYKRLQNQN